MKAQVDRILQSETLRNADALRRLFSYLAEKTLSGEADHLKEYTIGLDAFGKPGGYDPRHDSIVRLQVGRLRQKLTEYYLTEGKDDPLVIDLPKGHFKLNCEPRLASAASPTNGTGTPSAVDTAARWRRISLGLAILLLVAVAWGSYASIQRWRAEEPLRAAWTPELETLWEPFLARDRPLVVSIGSPLFVIMTGGHAYRDLSVNRWEEALRSPSVAAVREALHNPGMQPRYHYVPADELDAAFLLGKLLATRKPQISVARSTNLSLRQLEMNNVVLIGSPSSFDDVMRGLPVQQAFLQERSGIRNLHPGAGEPEFFTDENSRGASEDGEVFTLITLAPGPLGNGEVACFTSSTTPGRLTAVRWFTDATLARTLTNKLKRRDGSLPPYYQLVVKAKYMDTVPVETSYVTHRELPVSVQRSGP